MIKLNIFLSITLFCFQAFAQYDPPNDRAVMVLYVSPVKAEVDNGKVISKLLSNTIRSILVKSKKYKLANPEFEESIEKAKNYNEACLSLEECARREAKALDADLVLITELTSIYGECNIDMRLENIYSKQILKSKSMRSSCNISDYEDKVTGLVYHVMTEDVVKASGQRDAYFTTNPPGANVNVDGKFLGTTPLETKINIGQNKILLEIPKTKAFAPILVSEVVEDSSTKWVYHKNFALKNSYLVIKVTPSGANIKIDGKPIDKENSKIPVDSNVSHTVQVSYDKYETQSVNVPALEEDEVRDLNIKLDPLPCKVLLSSSPDGASVYSDSIFIGDTPLNKQFKTGEHELLIKRVNYEQQTVSFYCSPDEDIQRVISLNRLKYTEEEQKRIDKAKTWRITSYAGFAASAALGFMAYQKLNDYSKIDKDYSSTKDPFEIERLAKSRDEAKSSVMIYSASSIIGFGLSYLFYKWGEFPKELMYKDLIVLSPKEDGVELAWNHSW